jgi:hypothetical protein
VNGPRTLSDADIEAMTTAFERRMEERFYNNLGKGLWGIIWKAVLVAAIAIAAYGAAKGAA